ncbi:S8 family peptidase [Paracidovorax citrulli]|uniref:Peptidase S8 and S53, subtilisin, kexin, sedolisin n=2 Tax=Paracidovorax citrulli TaxID=80869 RepID=A1TQB7_PARC0|nr:S8 family serine peptidase [Paracidovorax citrulli]ABM33155.1 peptidase S8 and S53, subtilisin, kexin, sedolisin [Paracidovorax citrulli AAC00-1]ATG96803.1 serine protease [Paracidovorax citrulli]UEG48186.1 S8 family serine peptidase [Paracidovorax citrulli]WIY31419.1 S8 family serine peptidase [Paracidovorax citrulli]WIY40697.1 S8 family serine peptidase [Paracidovorax citrulli]
MERLRRPALLSALALLAACANPSPGAPPSVPAAPAPGATAPEAADLSMRENSSRYVIVALANPLQRVPVRAATSPAGYGAPPRYTTGMHAATLVEQIAREHQLVQAAAWPIPSLNVHCIVFEILDSRPREEVLAALAKDDRIALAQPLQDFSVQEQPTARTADAAVAYNDPYAPLQRGFIGTSAAQAHRVTTGRGTHVAVIDTGAQTGHPDLQGRILETHNLVDDDAGAFQKDRHGTEVLGIMAATGNNLQGIVGMAPAARFSLYKACWYPAQPPGSGARCNSFTLAKALVAVMSSDARIVNMSLGGPSDPLLGQLLSQLVGQGRIIVAAVPAGGQRGGFPAGVPGVLAVDSAGAPRTPSPGGVLLAPGTDILTLQPQGRYDFASGSSMAAAHVSGMVALLQSVEPRLDRDTVERLLLRSENQDGAQPAMVNAERALATISSSSPRFAAR